MRARRSIVAAVTTAMVATLPAVGLLATPAANAAVGDISYVGGNTTAGSRANHRVVVPASVTAGDQLVLFLTTNSSTAAITAPAGWSLVETRDGNGIRGRAWTRTATANDAGTTVTAVTSASVKSVMSVAAYESSIGVASVSATASSVGNASTSSLSTPTVPVVGENSWLVNFWSGKSANAVTFTLPGDVTQRGTGAAAGSGRISAVLADSAAAVPVGTAAARTATTSPAVSRNALFSVVVQPGSDEAPGNNPPSASFTASCTGMTCSVDASGSSDGDDDPLTYSWAFGDGGTATGVTASRTYATEGAKTITLTVSDGTATDQATRTVNVSLPVGGPGHTSLASDTVLTNQPRITSGEIWDLEYIGNTVYIAGGFTSIRNNASGNTTNYNQPYLASWNVATGLVNANFRPTFDGGVTDIEASPDGTKLYVAGRFNTVNGVTKRKFASINPSTGATVTGFTAHANGAGTELEATNTTVFLGGQFTTINGRTKVGLAAVDAATGALVGRTNANPDGTWSNDISGGIGPNGALNVQEMKLTPDLSTLMVVHTGRQIDGQNRYGAGLIDVSTGDLLPWRTRLWEDNLGLVGGVQRAYGGDISPDGTWFAVTSGSGGDRPPINDTVMAFPIAGGDNVEPLWISRAFDSIYGIAISEQAVYIGGHFAWNESPTARDPWPGLDDRGYGTGQGLSGYGLGDDVVRREHLGALDHATGKALEWNPWSNSFEGNKAMLAMPGRLVTGGDATTQGAQNVGRIAVFNLLGAPTAVDTDIVNPIEGRVEEAGAPFVVEGTARATGGVNRVQVEIRNRDTNRYLQDDLVTWGAANTINATLANPGAATTNWSLELNLTGNLSLEAMARTVANGGAQDSTKDINKFETFGTTDATPTGSITGPSGIIPTQSFTVTGSANDDFGVQGVSYTIRDSANRYLQDDGSAIATYNSFNATLDVPGALSTTWSDEVTVPYEGEWKIQVAIRDNAGQSSLDTVDRTWTVSSTAVAPTVNISTPVVMNPPTAVTPLVVTPGTPMSFSGSASDDEGLANVEIQLRNTTTGEAVAADGTWGVQGAGWYRVTPINVSGTSTNWSYTTPFNLSPGSYSFSVRANDDLGLSTSGTNQGRLTINAQVAGDNPPNALLNPVPTPVDLNLALAGTATDDFGVESVRVALRDADTNRYLQPNGTLAAAFATVNATLETPNATSTNWSLNLVLPTEGDWRITAYGYDTAGQQDLSTSGATGTYRVYPGDLPPVVLTNLQLPTSGAVFTDGKIVVSGRVEDDRQIENAQVAIVNSLGQYMSASGTFTSTNESWRNAFLNSPGSPGSNYSYTTPVLPAGVYTVRVRGVDSHGFATNPTYDVTDITVQVPASNPPVPAFTVECGTGGDSNICTLDARTTTDENIAGVTYSWAVSPSGSSGPSSGAVVTRTFTTTAPYTVTLTARDEWGNTATLAQMVTVTEPTDNAAPTATAIDAPACTGLACSFTGRFRENLSDSTTRVWSWGDGTANTTSTGTVGTTGDQVVTASHTFPAAGTYTVTFTVTDGWGDLTTVTREVTVTAP